MSLPHKYITTVWQSVNFLFAPSKQKPSTWLGSDLGCERELGSQDFGEVGTDSALIGTVELHHVFLDTSLADD